MMLPMACPRTRSFGRRALGARPDDGDGEPGVRAPCIRRRLYESEPAAILSPVRCWRTADRIIGPSGHPASRRLGCDGFPPIVSPRDGRGAPSLRFDGQRERLPAGDIRKHRGRWNGLTSTPGRTIKRNTNFSIRSSRYSSSRGCVCVTGKEAARSVRVPRSVTTSNAISKSSASGSIRHSS